jgi:hypothetical protein
MRERHILCEQRSLILKEEEKSHQQRSCLQEGQEARIVGHVNILYSPYPETRNLGRTHPSASSEY